MTTLKDIAADLGVSVSTVSRALNDTGRISAELREAIKTAAKKAGYYPNETARSLKTRRTSMIGVIAPDITDSFYAKLLKGISREALNRGYTVVFCDSNGDLALEAEYYKLLLSKNVCGIIIATAGENSIYADSREEECLVFVDNSPVQSRNAFCVSIDHEKAGYELTSYLIAKGCKKISVITGNMKETSASYRLKGHLRCMEERGLAQSGTIYEGDFHYESGYIGMKNMLGCGDLPDAVVAHNCLIAYGAIAALHECGLRVPEDISVACFDAVDDTNIYSPKLTCIVSPVDELAKTSVDLVISRFEEKGRISEEKRDILLDYTFFEGKST